MVTPGLLQYCHNRKYIVKIYCRDNRKQKHPEGDMRDENISLSEFIEKDVNENKGRLVPVRASLPEIKIVKKLKLNKIHLNPDDEFCDPKIGPSQSAINKYVQMISRYGTLMPNADDEPLIVQKVHPDGYMLLNGHHRWAAAYTLGFEPLPVRIVNLTQETDIKEMLRNSKHDKRVTLDLNEVVFCDPAVTPAEPPVKSFVFKNDFREPVRLGVPAILHYLEMNGYDIWLYTAEYYSTEYIRELFKRYSVKVDGIITGTGRKVKDKEDVSKMARKLLESHYNETITIDSNEVLRTVRDHKDFEEYPIKADPDQWSNAVMVILERIVGRSKR